EHADVRPTPTGVWVYGDSKQVLHPLSAPDVPRAEVVDELYGAAFHNVQPLHNGTWARETLAVCLALLESAANNKDIRL
ncbi:MAG TPA: gfo/Idh/MocA family oxidoreductase, partial [Ramlibacter sp.]|nr:gfo/Idh/MocA family oxidoreductase [Ramlibacter sp.]